jgi:hypothetical protein
MFETAGAIVADEVNVYWVVQVMSGDTELVSCPITGCPSAGSTVLASKVVWGWGPTCEVTHTEKRAAFSSGICSLDYRAAAELDAELTGRPRFAAP